ncbi:MAG: hypothetical protein K8T89_24745 [Planctomycetes bacterium]|nr:hypothetical protein [Planctomycetota bacterium]
MASSDESITHKLQKPGSGLPWWELLAARYIVFPHICRKLSWAAAAKQFQDEGSRVLAAFDALPAEKLREPVLIRRVAGMEDSSRYWSAAMTVEHLTMVGTAIRQTISSLRRGVVPTIQPRVENFKPKGAAEPAEIRSAFVRLLAEAEAAEKVEPAIPRGEGPKYAHPWFGPMDAYQWNCLISFHQSIHRKQIEAIQAGLGIS